jgi:hypothetical protein
VFARDGFSLLSHENVYRIAHNYKPVGRQKLTDSLISSLAMVTLEIIRWRENPIGFSGWDAHATAELKRRLRSAVSASPGTLRDLSRRILNREPVVLDKVRDDAAAGIRHIVESMGAEVTIREARSQRRS